jgi:hypothetical protein
MDAAAPIDADAGMDPAEVLELDAGAIEDDSPDYVPTGEEEEELDEEEGEGAEAANADADNANTNPADEADPPHPTATAAATAATDRPPPVVLLRPPDLSTIVTPPEVAAFAAAVAEKSAAAAMTPSPASPPPPPGEADAAEAELGDGGEDAQTTAAAPADAAATTVAATTEQPPPSLEQLQDRATRLLQPPPHRPYLAGVPRDDGTGAYDVYAVLPGQKPPVGATLLLEVASQRPGAAPPPVRRYQRQLFAQVVSMHAQLEHHGRDMDVAQRAVAACGIAAAPRGATGGNWGGGANGNNANLNTNTNHHHPGGGTRGPAPGAVRRDPAAPKRAMTAYLAFAVRQRAAIVEEATAGGVRPVPPPTEVMRLLAEAWRSAPAEEREACERMAQEDRLRYERERAAYTGPLTMRVGPGRGGGGGGGGAGVGGAGNNDDGDGDLVEAAMAPFRQAMMMGAGGATRQQQQQQQQQGQQNEGDAGAGAVGPNGGKLKGPRARDAPPLPRSAYLLFVTDFRKNLERGVPFGEATRRAAEAWRGASAEDRAPFEAEAARDQARFGEDMRRYREGTYVVGGASLGVAEMES